MDSVVLPKSERRMGPQGSENWLAMLDAAEAILREQGHAELTSRSIADRIGVKQRLVYYYFRTMDDLVIALFRRMAEREVARLRAAAATERPLRTLWDISLGSTDARLISEFMALANRIDGLKCEVIHFIEEARALEVGVLSEALTRAPRIAHMGAPGFAVMITSLALLLTRESQLGVSSGHADVMSALAKFLDELEPLDAPSAV